MTLETQTPYIALWDTDVIAPVEQIRETVRLLRTNAADFVYPYKHYLLDTSDILRKLYFETGKIEVLMKNRKKMKEMYSPNPVGGAVFCNREKYIKAGMENEKFYGWGLEDGERIVRWERLLYQIKRVEGPLFHLSHPRGLNSNMQHPDQQVIKMKEQAFSNRLT
jgi:predicted glycosyltransferase involved in capsule biosynthesis